MTRSVNSLRYARTNTRGADALKTKLNKNVVPYRTLTTSEFDEGQQSFVRKILNFVCKCVVPIISHYSSLDDTQYVYNVDIVFSHFDDLYFLINCVGVIPIYSLNCRLKK